MASRWDCPFDIAFSRNAKPVQMFCGKWGCPRCAKMNARQWAWRVRLHIEEVGGEWYFLTFTLSGTVGSVSDGYKLLPKLWDTMRKSIQRFYRPQKWQYVAFVEGQPRRFGMPHFHIISSLPCPYRIKDFAVAAGFGHQAKQGLLTSDKAAGYVSKYASKMDKRQPKNLRHVRVSRGWTKLPKRKGGAYIVRSRKEKTWQFINRVSEITGRPQEEIGSAYLDGLKVIQILNNRSKPLVASEQFCDKLR